MADDRFANAEDWAAKAREWVQLQKMNQAQSVQMQPYPQQVANPYAMPVAPPIQGSMPGYRVPNQPNMPYAIPSTPPPPSSFPYFMPPVGPDMSRYMPHLNPHLPQPPAVMPTIPTSPAKKLPSWLRDQVLKETMQKVVPQSSGLPRDTAFYQGNAYPAPKYQEDIANMLKDDEDEEEEHTEEGFRIQTAEDEELVEQIKTAEIKSNLTSVLIEVTDDILKDIAQSVYKEASKQPKPEETKPVKVVAHTNVLGGLVAYGEESDEEEEANSSIAKYKEDQNTQTSKQSTSSTEEHIQSKKGPDKEREEHKKWKDNDKNIRTSPKRHEEEEHDKKSSNRKSHRSRSRSKSRSPKRRHK